jgi:D-aminoacyl-tRNA deacylase
MEGKTALIISTLDPAGMNMREFLLKDGGFTKQGVFEGEAVYVLDNISLYTINSNTIIFEYPEKKIGDADRFIFVTKHASASAIPTLSVHAPGNWGPADMGGTPAQLGVAMPLLAKHALQIIRRLLDEQASDMGFELVQEVTHHGPASSKPAMFIEIGSTKEQWVRKDAGALMAKAIRAMLSSPLPAAKCAVGVGGLHTMPNFMRLIIEGEYAIGHTCPKYALEHFNEEMPLQSLTRSNDECNTVILDWKGLGPHKQRIKDFLDTSNVDVLRTNQIR